MPDTMFCPRREESPAADRAFPGPDKYRPDGGLVGQALACSYCGSLPPDDFMEAVRQGAEVGPTDKSYKAYLRLPDGGEAKFYFQHLSEDQRREFIDLLNARPRRVAIGYPGRFYVLPFFIAPAPQEDAQ